MTTQKLWVSDNGDVTCEAHAGMYLRCAIEAKPNHDEMLSFGLMIY